MFGLGGQEFLILFLIILVLFGGSKIPQMMRGVGEGMKEFKKATRDEDEPAVKSASTDSTTPHHS